MTVTISDGKTTLEWNGMWTHARSGFEVDREINTVRQVFILAERGLTHVYGSEAASKFNALKDKGKATPDMRDDIVGAARIEYREAMTNDTWASGTRVSRQTPQDRLQVLFRRDASTRTREMCNDNLTKADKKGYWLDSSGEAFDLDAWTDQYLANDDPDPQVPGKTIGQVRYDRHMEVARSQLAEEQRKAGEKVQTRKITGSKI